MDRTIGFSTGGLYKTLDTYSTEAIEALASVSTDVIEIMCTFSEHVKLMPALIPQLERFKVKTLHMPVCMLYANSREVRLMIGALAEFYTAIGATHAVIHPDLVDDWVVFNGRPMRFAVENMDIRKKNFHRPETFVEFFRQHPDWQFVLDLNHCYVNDSSLALADEFADLFGDRICEIHISGVGIDNYHVPLYTADQLAIVQKVPAGDCPIIIESPCTVRGLAREMEYIRRNIK